MKGFKPMLASEAPPFEKLQFPLYASPKLDGIRAFVHPELGLVSRNLKPIPNADIRAQFGPALAGLDGELIAGDPAASDCFRRTSSIVMSERHKDWKTVRFYVFDTLGLGPNEPFSSRIAHATRTCHSLFTWEGLQVIPVFHTQIDKADELREYEENALKFGHEGVMLRAVDGPYKFGRSTVREGWLMKLKRFDDCEAEVLAVYEQMRNENEAHLDELGRTKRSSHLAGKVGKGTAGGLRVRAINGRFKGVEFDVGSGFDDAIRQELWDKRDQLAGRSPPLVKVKYFPHGSKDSPRFPVYLGGWPA